jgi:hypothetical protein
MMKTKELFAFSSKKHTHCEKNVSHHFSHRFLNSFRDFAAIAFKEKEPREFAPVPALSKTFPDSFFDKSDSCVCCSSTRG